MILHDRLDVRDRDLSLLRPQNSSSVSKDVNEIICASDSDPNERFQSYQEYAGRVEKHEKWN